MSDSPENVHVPPGTVQKLFAHVLFWGNALGVLCLSLSFCVYVSGNGSPYMSMAAARDVASRSLADFHGQVHVETGWAWMRYLDHSDYLNNIGLAVMSGVIIACFVAITVPFFRRRDWKYLILVVVQIAIFLAAMTGLVGGGH